MGGKVYLLYEVTHYILYELLIIYMKVLIIYRCLLTNLPPFHPYL